MRILLLAVGIFLLCLSFVLQGLSIAQLVEVRQLAAMTEAPKPVEIFTPIGTVYSLTIGSLAVGLIGFLALVLGIRRSMETAA